jgi:predicted DNA-binding mobile mystery protein A
VVRLGIGRRIPDKLQVLNAEHSERLGVMKRQERARLARMTLDSRFEQSAAHVLAQRPTRGWIRAVRDALGMTSRQLAKRMGITQPAVAQLERSEAAGAIQLASLRRAAAALDCDLVYALVPRTSLEATVRSRAMARARRDVDAIDLAMRLDDGSLDPAELRRRIEDYSAKLIASGDLWEEPEWR